MRRSASGWRCPRARRRAPPSPVADPPESGRASRVDPDVAFASPEPSSRPWPAVKLFHHRRRDGCVAPVLALRRALRARVASPAASSPAMIQFSDDGSPEIPGRVESPRHGGRRDVPRVAVPIRPPRRSRASRRLRRVAPRDARRARRRTSSPRVPADHLFTADARRCNSSRASAERLWRSLRASDVRARRHSASPDVSVTTSRGAGVLSDLGARVTHLAFAEARNWMRAHAFAAFAGWRFVTTRDANRRAATVRFRATRSNSITSRLFSSWRVDARRRATIRLGVSRMTFGRERRAGGGDADVAHASHSRPRSRTPSRRRHDDGVGTDCALRFARGDEGLADARAFELSRGRVSVRDARGRGVWALASTRDHHARVRAWDAFAVRWRASRRGDDDARVVSRHGGGA